LNLTRNGVIVLISVIFVAGAGTAYAGIVLPTITLAGNVVITGDTEPEGKLLDTNDEAGTSGQVLSSTETGTDWVDPADITSLTSRIENLESQMISANTVINKLEMNQGIIVDYVQNQLCVVQNAANNAFSSINCQIKQALNGLCQSLNQGNCAGSCSSSPQLSCNINLIP